MYFQMNSPRSDFFQCMACEPSFHLQDLASVQEHFSIEHSVPNILTSRATTVVALPSSLSCHTHSCFLPHKCLLCEPKGERELSYGELQEHMEAKHGKFFLKTWKQFCTFHCRCVLSFIKDKMFDCLLTLPQLEHDDFSGCVLAR